METYDTPVEQISEPAEQELSHSDKMIGVFTEPKATYQSMAKFPPRTIDWLLPFLILLAIVAITQILLMSNEEIYFQTKQKQKAETEKIFSEMVEKGQMTQEQADQQMEAVQERLDMGRQASGIILMTVSIFFIGFIVFFIVSGVYFLLSKFVLKGDGTFKSAMVAYGLASYIGVLSLIVASILAFAFGRMMQDVSVASLINADKSTFAGFLLAKLDIFTIWAYIVISIGLAKMFKSESTGKFYAVVFGLWIVWGLLMFALASAVPFLSFLNR